MTSTKEKIDLQLKLVGKWLHTPVDITLKKFMCRKSTKNVTIYEDGTFTTKFSRVLDPNSHQNTELLKEIYQLIVNSISEVGNKQEELDKIIKAIEVIDKTGYERSKSYEWHREHVDPKGYEARVNEAVTKLINESLKLYEPVIEAENEERRLTKISLEESADNLLNELGV